MMKIESLLRNKNTLLLATSALSAAAGASAGYALARKRLEAAYEKELATQIQMAKDHFALRYDKPSPQELVERALANRDVPNEEMEGAVRALTDYAGAATQGEVIEERPDPNEPIGEIVSVTEDGDGLHVKMNIFEGKEPILEHSSGSWDYDSEIATRTELEPYIIHHDEYFQGEKDYQQSELTYYAEDGVLCDERDTPIHDSENIVGDANLMRFGHGSKDNNILYIRNDRLEIDMTVVRSNGSYTREVLGIQHMDEPRRRGRTRRLRDDDE